MLTDHMMKEAYYRTDAIDLAQKLLGKLLIRGSPEGEMICRITETEAYTGVTDKGCHAYGGRMTARTRTMYLPGGHSYIYLIYGMYHCLNVVAADEGIPEAVLIRGAEPVSGIKAVKLDGPGKLCRAMDIDTKLNALPLYSVGELYISDDGYRDFSVMSGPRVNIGYAEEFADKPWRFYISGKPDPSAGT